MTSGSHIMELIQDKNKTLLLITTLAEEMPVNETLEILQKAKKDVKVTTGPVIVNAIFPQLFSESEFQEIKNTLQKNGKDPILEQVTQTFHLFQKRAELQNFYINKLNLSLDNKALVILPFLFRTQFDRKAIEELSEHLAHAFNENSSTEKIRGKK